MSQQPMSRQKRDKAYNRSRPAVSFRLDPDAAAALKEAAADASVNQADLLERFTLAGLQRAHKDVGAFNAEAKEARRQVQALKVRLSELLFAEIEKWRDE